MKWYWGDLHNHCAVSYGNGTPSRTIANARTHLDFCTITGHAFWPDMPMDMVQQNQITGMHLGGFAKLQYYWKDLLHQLNEVNCHGSFVTFPSYEWHSMAYGDHNCYFNADYADLIDAPDIKRLAHELSYQNRDFMLLPHHVGYTRGHRGLNWDHFDPKVSPLVEIYSNHGCGESDDAPHEYHHSMGPRVGETMIRTGLTSGHRFGFYASTDSHDGYPGHYGHGLVGVRADRLTRDSIWKALQARQTIATTGARIAVEMNLAEASIGQTLQIDAIMPLHIRVEGTAPLDKVELIEGNYDGRWCVRRLQIPSICNEYEPGRYKIKVEMGWGRGKIRSSWDVHAKVIGGKLLAIDPCFRYSGYGIDEENASERILNHDDKNAQWICHAIPNPAGAMGGTHFNAGGTQAVILDVEASSSTKLNIRYNGHQIELPFQELVERSVSYPTGGFGSPAIKIHRATPQREFYFEHKESYSPRHGKPGFVYLRVTQTDAQVAWVSPIWFD